MQFQRVLVSAQATFSFSLCSQLSRRSVDKFHNQHSLVFVRTNDLCIWNYDNNSRLNLWRRRWWRRPNNCCLTFLTENGRQTVVVASKTWKKCLICVLHIERSRWFCANWCKPRACEHFIFCLIKNHLWAKHRRRRCACIFPFYIIRNTCSMRAWTFHLHISAVYCLFVETKWHKVCTAAKLSNGSSEWAGVWRILALIPNSLSMRRCELRISVSDASTATWSGRTKRCHCHSRITPLTSFTQFRHDTAVRILCTGERTRQMHKPTKMAWSTSHEQIINCNLYASRRWTFSVDAHKYTYTSAYYFAFNCYSESVCNKLRAVEISSTYNQIGKKQKTKWNIKNIIWIRIYASDSSFSQRAAIDRYDDGPHTYKYISTN